MACSTDSLKLDLKMLKEIFPKTHERFQITQSSTDQLTCRFIGKNGKKYDVHATIPDFYPSDPAIWYTDSEEANVLEIVENLSETSPNASVLTQIGDLLRALCDLNSIQLPNEAMGLMPAGASSVQSVADADPKQVPDEEVQDYADADDTGDTDDMEIDDFEPPTELDDSVFAKEEKTEDEVLLKKTHLKVFEKARSSPNSHVTTSRLMKEMREIYRSETFKNGDYTVDMVDDSVYNWNVELRSIDKESALYKDLMELKKKEGIDCIQLNMTFNDKYPIEPPFVRVVYPVLSCKHVVGGGAICTELLLKQCWSPGYTIESVIIQMAALFVKGDARIDFKAPRNQYSLHAAKRGFTEVTGAKSSGWFDRFKESS